MVLHSLTRESAIIQQAGLGDKKHGETEDDMLAGQESSKTHRGYSVTVKYANYQCKEPLTGLSVHCQSSVTTTNTF